MLDFSQRKKIACLKNVDHLSKPTSSEKSLTHLVISEYHREEYKDKFRNGIPTNMHNIHDLLYHFRTPKSTMI